MSSKRKLGLHSDRYPEGRGDYKRLRAVDTQGLDGRFIDIACIDTGNVWLNCWPSPDPHSNSLDGKDSGVKCRRWGMVDSKPAAVMPFRINAGHDADCEIRNFQIDLVLDKTADGSIPSGDLVGQQEGTTNLDVCLLDIPRPLSLVGTSKTSDSGSQSIPWKFSSRSIADSSTGRARTARWTWTANNNAPRLLHGAIAVEHLGCRFYIVCLVRGQAYRGRTPFRFGNQDHADKTWFLDPKIAEEDLQPHIENLETQITQLNLGAEGLNVDLSKERRLLAVVPPSSVGSNYGSSSIGGSSQVHQGNNIVNHFYAHAGGANTVGSGPKAIEVLPREDAVPVPLSLLEPQVTGPD